MVSALANESLLFFGKLGDARCERALQFCRQVFSSVQAHFGEWKQPFPQEAREWKGQWIISYLSRWVIPESVLANAERGAINFHPASPEYPGIGCNNFALYENATEYGATCHHMARVVDTGSIIAVKRFRVFANDTVKSLLERTYDHQLALFYEVLAELVEGRPLPTSHEQWTRAPFTRKQFNELSVLDPTMSESELRRRVRATSYGPWQPTMTVHGVTFVYQATGEKPAKS